MEQHPIPQNVSSYQFKLVGDMTLKQFFQLAGGILAGLIFYSSPLLAIIKWPLSIISVLLGIGLAFLPFEERPLEKWIFAFFRAIYSPTNFLWKKSLVNNYFLDEPNTNSATPTEDSSLKDYLAKTTVNTNSVNSLEKAESGFLSKLSSILSGNFSNNTQPKIPVPQKEDVVISTSPVNTGNTNPSTQAVATTQTTKDIKIPETPLIKIEPSRIATEDKKPTEPTVFPTQSSTPVQPIIAGNEIISTRQAIFSVDAAPPNPPTTPNVVVGQIIDQDRKIVEGAIMEIRDSLGRPIRALRSNKAGHFITVTQLDNGHYEIITEKEGYEFTAISFDATGNIIPPILVQGKRLGPIVEDNVIVKPLYSIN